MINCKRLRSYFIETLGCNWIIGYTIANIYKKTVDQHSTDILQHQLIINIRSTDIQQYPTDSQPTHTLKRTPLFYI